MEHSRRETLNHDPRTPILNRQRVAVIADREHHAVEGACVQSIRVARQALQRRRSDARETCVTTRAKYSEICDESPELLSRFSASNRERLPLLIP
jgi:hypothetical protein